MTKPKRKLEDTYYPVPQDFSLVRTEKLPENKAVIKRIIQDTVRQAYRLKKPTLHDWHGNPIKPKAVATPEQVEMVIHLIEALQPQDAIEAALASQFAITYIRAMEKDVDHGCPTDLFEFGHEVLEALQKYRSKGAQQISVQYVNKGHVGDVINVKQEEQPITLDAK